MLNFEHDLYLKKEAPYLKYDMNVCIKSYIKLIGKKDFPPDYKCLYEDLISYSKKKVKKPKVFTHPYRYYITTNTFYILFIMYEVQSKHGPLLYDFAKSFFCLSDSPYGNFDDYHYGKMYSSDGINEEYARKFRKENGFFPVDYLAMPQLLFFDNDHLITNRSISSWQLAIILEKYKNQNLVDIKTMSNDYFQYDEWDAQYFYSIDWKGSSIPSLYFLVH